MESHASSATQVTFLVGEPSPAASFQPPSPNIPQWIESLASDSPVERESARSALVVAGDAALIPLLAPLKSPISRVRWEAAKSLGAIKNAAAATALAENLDHDDDAVRWATADALIALGTAGLKQTLVVLLTKSKSFTLRQAAHHVIWHFAHRYSGEFLRPLLTKFRAYEPAVAIPPAALKALKQIDEGILGYVPSF